MVHLVGPFQNSMRLLKGPFLTKEHLERALFLSLFVFIFLPFALFSQTIAEKKASLSSGGSDLTADADHFLRQVNRELTEAHQQEQQLTQKAYELYRAEAPASAYQSILAELKEVRAHAAQLQESWREMAVHSASSEGYALWYQPETTLGQLIIDYGSQDFVYVMKPEIAAVKISVDSNIPIPRASWEEMLGMILTQNGVGIKELNPFLRELYFLKDDRSSVKLITNRRMELDLVGPEARVAFVLTPQPTEARRVSFFLESFANPESTQVQLVGRDIFLVARAADLRELLRLYDFVAERRTDREYKAVALSRVKAQDLAHVLEAVFYQEKGKERGEPPRHGRLPSLSSDVNGLQILTLGQSAQAIFLVGTAEEIRRAEELIREIEAQIAGGSERVIYWYTVKHSEAAQLAEVLSKVYDLMVATGVGKTPEGGPTEIARNSSSQNKEGSLQAVEQRTVIEQRDVPQATVLPPLLYPQDPYFQTPVQPVLTAPVLPAGAANPKERIDMGNFIVDIKTGSIVMVVEVDILPKIKELIRKLDVPKRMVQLEVLLFEKKIAKQNNYGLNLLKLGSQASNTTSSSMLFNLPNALGAPSGIFDFLWSHEQTSGIPAFDMTYRFLLSQDDITINSNPSVLTVNQTPAFIAIQEEISVNTGILEIETAKGVTLKDAFQRAQYGITIKVTPTIHPADEEGGVETITLDSDITFDTFDTLSQLVDSRPNITRRNVQNQARVADGETVIIGGLRKKVDEDRRDSIPFIGEIPGVGKLFSDTSLRDDSTEMFIFITAKIVDDPACDLERIRREELMRRPGDVPEFLCMLVETQQCEKRKLFDGWMTLLFGRDPTRCYTPSWHDDDTCGQFVGEYDGR